MTRPRRWSDRLEGQRGGAEAAAREAAIYLSEIEDKILAAQSVLMNNPTLAARYLTEAMALAGRAGARQERIIRLMIEAAHGLE